MPKHIKKSSIPILLRKVKSLDYKQKDEVREMLERIISGGIYKIELKKELQQLYKKYKISDIDRRGIEAAIFDSE